MGFKTWLQNESVWYHGTQDGDKIRRSQKMEVSTAGGGQRGLLGVWLTKDHNYATTYAKVKKENPGPPEVLEVDVPDNLNIADLYSIEKEAGNANAATKARWSFVGIDIDDTDSLLLKQVRDMQPFAMTKLLQQKGYDGALIPNTIQTNGSPELVIFNPGLVRLAY